MSTSVKNGGVGKTPLIDQFNITDSVKANQTIINEIRSCSITQKVNEAAVPINFKEYKCCFQASVNKTIEMKGATKSIGIKGFFKGR